MTETVDGLLGERAGTHRDEPFLRLASGDLTFGEVDAQATRVAGGLADLGVRAGHLVAMLLPNCAETVLTWFGAVRLGAVAAPMNTDFRGPTLTHALNLAGAEVLVVADDLCAALEPIAGDLHYVRTLVVLGAVDRVATFPAWRVLPFAVLRAKTSSPTPSSGHGERDPALVLFTSGTTGRSKGCVLSHRYAVRQAELMVQHLKLHADDVLYSPFPLFHLDAAVFTVMPALVLGTTAAIGVRFSASGFWAEVRAFGATVFDFMGATLTILHKPEFAPDFERRFGLRLVECYGSTDVGVPIYTRPDERPRPGSCGRPIDAYQVQLVDTEHRKVGVGEVAEIVVRPNERSLISDGYLGMPEETVRVTRNLWFHTGDLARQDADGFVYFVGRRTDAIRRRGENISAFEVEEVIELHPDVL